MNRVLKLVLLFTFMAACVPGGMQAHAAWARPTALGGNAAVYLLLDNGTRQADVLVGVSTNAARAVEIHHSRAVGGGEEDTSSAHQHSEEEGSHPISELEMQDMAGVMIMEPLSSVEIGAGKELLFEPGGYHLMLIDVQNALRAGDSFMITLHFEHAANLDVIVNVLSP